MDGTTNSPDQHPVPGRPDPNQPPAVVLVMEPGRDRELLESFLRPHHDVHIAGDHPFRNPETDVVLFDILGYDHHHTNLHELQASTGDDAPPAMLVAPTDAPHRESPTVWETVDDIVVTPTDPTELEARIDRLVTEHRRATRLAQRERQFTDVVADLDVANRSLDAAPVGIVIIDATDPEKPIADVNEAFTTLTGYSQPDLVGSNPRVLAGPRTEPEAMAILKTAVDSGDPATTEITNYRADGTRFLDHVETAPVANDAGRVTHHIEFHRDVTRRRLRENRLHVINRLLRHNLRNDLNQVEGYAELLATQLDNHPQKQYAETMAAAATNLIDLGEKLHRAEDALECRSQHNVAITVGDVLDSATTFLDDYPGVTHSTECAVDTDRSVPQIVTLALEELLDNAIIHHPETAPTIDVTVTDDTESLITVTVSDDGPGLTDGVETILETGESPLRHGDGIGLWVVKWIVDLLGGRITFDAETDGTTAHLTVPTTPPKIPP